MQQHASSEPTTGIPSRLCSVCGDISTGIHFGGNSCESCKAFFRRSVQCSRYQNYKCSNEEQCPVNIVTRKVCQACRYRKCTSIGMKPKWVLTDQERAEKYGSRRKRFREQRTNEEDPEIYKFLSKDEKLLIEDIAHALYQSRATYPLQFPKELNHYLAMLASGKQPPSPASPGEKPPSPSANFLIVPIQRFVLFARMLKDFDLFSEDDKVNLLKGSAIEVVVCSSNTLFNPKTHTFTNYISRDQRAVMSEQVLPLDPLLMKLWGDEIFNRTKTFLISMCNLQIDEVASTLLVPILLFSPDRSNIKDLELVKRLQSKYVTLANRYMNWRYGPQDTEVIFPKLLLQLVNIRTLGLAHAEIIQKVMATSSVNPLVQEVAVKQEATNRPTTASGAGELASFPSTPSGSEMTDYDKPASMEAESNLGSDDERDDETDESNPRNIWRKRRKLSNAVHDEPFKLEPTALVKFPPQVKSKLQRSNSLEADAFPHVSRALKRPHDHQVPSYMPAAGQDEALQAHKATSFRHLPPKKQSLSQRSHLQDQIHRPHSSSTNDLIAYEQHYARSHSHAPSPLPMQPYHDVPFEQYHHPYARMSPASYQQQQQNEQHLLLLSLANNQSQASAASSLQSRANKPLDANEQRLLDAIHAHPNKRDLVMNLLRQMNESSMSSATHFPGELQHRQQSEPYPHNVAMDDQDDSY